MREVRRSRILEPRFPRPHPPLVDEQPLRILLVDDEEGAFLMTQAMLGSLERFPAKLDWARTFDEALEALTTGEYDVFLVDYYLGTRTGLELLEEARDRAIRTPMIMVTGKGSRDVDLEAMSRGASDYLVKSNLVPAALERSIRYAVERARAAEAVRESEARHRGMFDHLPLGLYRCAPDGTFVDANPALVRMLGFPAPTELREHYAANFYLAEADRARFLSILSAEGELHGFESIILDTAGRPLRVRNTARAHRDASGTIDYIEGAVEAAAAGSGGAQKAAARYRTLVGTLRMPLMRLDVQGRVLDASPAFGSKVGARADEWLTRSIGEIVDASALDDVEAASTDPAVATPPTTWSFGSDEIRVRLAAVPDGVGEADEVLVLPVE